jgi:hypothetical protein
MKFVRIEKVDNLQSAATEVFSPGARKTMLTELAPKAI